MREASHPRVRRYEQITYSDIKKLDVEKTFVIATMSPLEVHGPHLPFGNDMFEGYKLAEFAAVKVAEKLQDWNFLLLPPVPVAADTLPKMGSIEFPSDLVERVAYHLMEPFAKLGFKRLAYSSFHGGPRHFTAMEAAAEKLTKRYDTAAVSLFSAVLARVVEGNIFLDGLKEFDDCRMDKEKFRQDHHAAFVETCLALHLYPELVQDGWQELTPSVSDGNTEVKDVNDSFLYGYEDKAGLRDTLRRNWATMESMLRSVKHYRESTYHGYPAFASEQQGAALFDHLANVCAGIVEVFIEQGEKMNPHSPLWKLKPLILNRPLGRFVNLYMNQTRDE